jgi:hypothetical protein
MKPLFFSDDQQSFLFDQVEFEYVLEGEEGVGDHFDEASHHFVGGDGVGEDVVESGGF